MRKAMFLAAILAFSAHPAGALFFNGGVKQTTGNMNYNGTSVYADFGGDLHLRPTFSTFHSNATAGAYRTYGARLGLDLPVVGIGVSGGATPKVNGYGNTYAGADVAVSLSPTGSGPVKRITGANQGGGAARGKGLARVDLGAGVTYTQHRDDFGAALVKRTSTMGIGQTDFKGTVGVSFLDNLLSADFTKSAYDHNLAAISARGAMVQNLSGLDSTIQGYPNTSVNLRLEMSMVPVIAPYVGFTRTTFQLNQPSMSAYSVGAYVEMMILEASASYQRQVVTGQTAQNLYSLGASVRF